MGLLVVALSEQHSHVESLAFVQDPAVAPRSDEARGGPAVKRANIIIIMTRRRRRRRPSYEIFIIIC